MKCRYCTLVKESVSCQLPLSMVEEIVFENGNFQGLVTLTLDQVILHTIVHHSLTSTYMPNFTEIKETFCGLMDVHTFETHFIRLTQKK